MSFDINKKSREDKLVIEKKKDIIDVIGGKEEIEMIGKIMRGKYIEGRIIRRIKSINRGGEKKDGVIEKRSNIDINMKLLLENEE